MNNNDKLDRLRQLKLLQLQKEHLSIDRYFNKYRLPDGYIKGKGNNKSTLGTSENPTYFDNGINANSNTCVAFPQNIAGFYGRAPGLSDPPLPIRRTETMGAHTNDASANGTETDVFACANSGTSYAENQDGNVIVPNNVQIISTGGRMNWAGTNSQPPSGVEAEIDINNGKARVVGYTSDQHYAQVTPHLRPGMSCTKGLGNNYAVSGQGATYDIMVSAQKDEVDPTVDYISAGAESGSEENEINVKVNEYNEYARVTLDANNGRISLTITGGEKQYNSTIIMTCNDINCTTHTFRVIAEDEIDLIAGEQTSTITMVKNKITVHSKTIAEMGDMLITMNAKLIQQNCSGVVPVPLPIPAVPGLSAVTGSLTSAVSNLAGGALSNVTGALGGMGNALGGLTSGLSGALGGIGNALGGLTSGLGGALQSVAGGLGGALSSVTGAINGIGGALGNIAGGLSNALGSVTGAIGGVVGNIAGGLGNIVSNSGIGNAIGGALSSVTGAIGGVVGNLTGSLGNVLGGMGNIAGGLSGALGNVTGAIGGALGKAGEFIGNIAGQAGGVIGTVVKGASTLVGKATEVIGGAVGKAADFIGNFAQNAASVVSTTVGKLTDMGSKALSKVTQGVADKIQNTTSGIQEAAGKAMADRVKGLADETETEAETEEAEIITSEITDEVLYITMLDLLAVTENIQKFIDLIFKLTNDISTTLTNLNVILSTMDQNLTWIMENNDEVQRIIKEKQLYDLHLDDVNLNPNSSSGSNHDVLDVEVIIHGRENEKTILEAWCDLINRQENLTSEEKALLCECIERMINLSASVFLFNMDYSLTSVIFNTHLLSICLTDLLDYVQKWSQLTMDRIESTKLITVNQIENDMALAQIEVLRIKEQIKITEANATAKENLINDLNGYLSFYIDINDDLIHLMKDWDEYEEEVEE